MEEANYNYYKIDIADIWQYEQKLFLRGMSSEDLARHIIDKAEQLIIKEGEESFTCCNVHEGRTCQGMLELHEISRRRR